MLSHKLLESLTGTSGALEGTNPRGQTESKCRSSQICFCGFSPFPRKQGIWEVQILAANRRSPQETVLLAPSRSLLEALVTSHTSDILFPYRSTPETEPNGAETEPNGAETDRNQAFRRGTGGAFVGVGGVGGL